MTPWSANAPLISIPGDAPKNLLMVSIDTMRRDRVGRYADDPTLTPSIDRILDEAVVLDAHQSCANWTYPSILCALGGQTTVDIGYDPPVVPDKDEPPEPIPVDVTLLQDWLGDLGYDTAVVTANHLLCPDTGVAGYDHVDCVSGARAGEIVDLGLSRLSSMTADRPWFVHLHFMDPHKPYDPPQGYLDEVSALPPAPWDLSTIETTNAAIEAYASMTPEDQALLWEHLHTRYNGEVRFADAQIGRLWEEAGAAGWLEDTLVVFWTDHGEQLLERGYVGHGETLHVEENAAVAAFWARDLEPSTWAARTSHIDIVPTILGAMRMPVPREVTGKPVGTASAYRAIFGLQTHAYSAPRQSITLGNLRLIYRWDGPRSFHRLDLDPDEKIDLYARDDPSVQSLWLQLEPELWRVSTLVDDTPVDAGP